MAGRKFGDYDASLAMRDAIRRIVGEEIQSLRPVYRYGIVYSVNTADKTVDVVYNGESDPVTISVGHFIFAKIGDVVRIEGVGPDKFVADIIGWDGTGLGSGVNIIIDPNFRFNQVGRVSGANVPTDAYLFDMWKNTSGLATSQFYFGTSLNGNILTFGSNGNERRIAQTVERLNIVNFGSKVHTLSWRGTAFGRVYLVGSTPPAFADSPIVVDLAGTADVVVEFSSMALSNRTLYNVKLEAGPSATPFVLPDYQTELLRVYRHFQRFQAGSSNEKYASGFAAATTQGRFTIPLLAPMRITAPTLTYNALRMFDGTTVFNVSSLSLGATGGTNAQHVLATATGMTQYRPLELLSDAGGASFIAFDARL